MISNDWNRQVPDPVRILRFGQTLSQNPQGDGLGLVYEAPGTARHGGADNLGLFEGSMWTFAIYRLPKWHQRLDLRPRQPNCLS